MRGDAGTETRERAAPLRLSHDALARMRRAAVDAYPVECCGALVGWDGAGGRRVVRAVPVANAWAGWNGRRFLIPAGRVRALEHEAARSGLAVIGFYHSHPDGPAMPSAADRRWAWPWYSHLIVAVNGDGPGDARAWRLRDDRRGFVEERLVIIRRSTDACHRSGPDTPA